MVLYITPGKPRYSLKNIACFILMLNALAMSSYCAWDLLTGFPDEATKWCLAVLGIKGLLGAAIMIPFLKRPKPNW